jgi:hypothetical protein
MDKPLKSIFIPDPCHENWNKMTRVEKGRFCQSCQKKVFDFRNAKLSDVEFVFKKLNGNVCGTFYEDQINQDLKYTYLEKRSRLNKFRLYLAAYFATLWLKMFSGGNIQGQDISISTFNTSTNTYNFDDALLKSDSICKVKGVINGIDFKASNIKFRITTENREVILSSNTDVNGNFEFELPEDYQGKSIMLITQKAKNKTRIYIYTFKSTEFKIANAGAEELIIPLEGKRRKKLFVKHRVVLTGRFRM